jgi:hypothetical protein
MDIKRKLNFELNDDIECWWEDNSDKSSEKLTSSQEEDDYFIQLLYNQDNYNNSHEFEASKNQMINLDQHNKEKSNKTAEITRGDNSKFVFGVDRVTKKYTSPKDTIKITKKRKEGKEIDPVFANRGKKWILDEDLTLITQITKQNLSISEIALLHKRTELAIKLRLCKYALVISQTQNLNFNQISYIISSFHIEDIFFESTEKCQPTFAEIERSI